MAENSASNDSNEAEEIIKVGTKNEAKLNKNEKLYAEFAVSLLEGINFTAIAMNQVD